MSNYHFTKCNIVNGVAKDSQKYKNYGNFLIIKQ